MAHPLMDAPGGLIRGLRGPQNWLHFLLEDSRKGLKKAKIRGNAIKKRFYDKRLKFKFEIKTKQA